MRKKFSKILSVLLVLIMAVSIMPMSAFNASAAAVYTSGYYTYRIEYSRVTITDVNPSISGNITIPSTLGGYPVTEIGCRAFMNCDKITSVVIPDSVTLFGVGGGELFSGAFEHCDNLTTVTIEGLGTIERDAFKSCPKLTTVIIKEGTHTIIDGAFENCTSLTTITLPKSLTEIIDNSFIGCTKITTVNFAGTKEQWDKLKLWSAGNDYLFYATINYNYCAHSYTGIVITPATHLKEGIKRYTCTACSNSYTTTISKLAKHTYETVVTPPTCTEKGYTTYTCECGDSYVADYVDATGHSHNATVTKSTCTEKGYTTYTCKCGDSYITNYKGATGHDYDSGIVTTKPNCTKAGVKTFTCANCGDTYTEIIDKIAEHNHNATVTVPTCEDKGYTTYTCECGDTYVADYVKAKGHTAGEWVVTTPATTTTSGVKTQYCTVCETVLATQVIPATGKVHSVAISDVSLDYKASTTIIPSITADSGVKYTVTYSSSDPSVASIDANGKVSTGKTGSATIIVTVTDEFDNTVSDTCEVKVNYNWWQWIIVIVLFGWIWY